MSECKLNENLKTLFTSFVRSTSGNDFDGKATLSLFQKGWECVCQVWGINRV